MALRPQSGEEIAAHDVSNSEELGRHLKSKLKSGHVVLAGILAEFARPSLVAQYQQAGFDFLFIENEHYLYNATSLVDTIFAARSLGMPAIAKTGAMDRGEITRLLDSGAAGIQLPRTETREQLEKLLSFVKYPPVGSRAIAPGLGNSNYRQPADLRQWMRDQNDETLVVAHIETRNGFLNAEEIIATPGLDMVYVGPGDFSVSMGYPGMYDHPEVAGPMEQILVFCTGKAKSVENRKFLFMMKNGKVIIGGFV